MKVEKVINNNIVSIVEEDGSEIVIMGKGIGFKAKSGSVIDTTKIEKVFRLEDNDTISKFKDLLRAMPMEHIQVSAEIIEYAKSVITRRLNPNVYITLTDHISFMVERFQKGMMFANPLLWEIKGFYPSEYLIGEYAIALIHKKLGIKFTEDEAASIALHIVNAEYNTVMNETMNITKMIKEVLHILKDELKIQLDEGSLHYSRFVTHLKFLAQRIFSNELLDNNETEFFEMITKLYPEEFQCSLKVAQYIEEQYQHKISTEELAYLTVHIKRIQKETN